MTKQQKIDVLQYMKDELKLQLKNQYWDRDGLCDLLFDYYCRTDKSVTLRQLGIILPKQNYDSFGYKWPRTDAGMRTRIKIVNAAIKALK